MIDRMTDRCKRICGGMEKPCFVNSQDQLRCISDMVINKTTGISMTLGFSLYEEDKTLIQDMVRESIASSNELSNWIRYLQWVGDLKALSSLVLDSSAREKRKEIRYPMPEAKGSVVAVEIDLPEGRRAVGSILNFSQSGLLLTCQAAPALQQGAQLQCSLLPSGVAMGGGMRVPFGVVVKYASALEGGEAALGLRVSEVMGSGTFNFFNEVYNIIMAHQADI